MRCPGVPIRVIRPLLGLTVLFFGTMPAAAQTFEAVGTRALGMGGAFVAVADDSTAVYWNPAGLANSAVVDTSLQHTSAATPRGSDRTPVIAGGLRESTTFFAFAIPSLGLSYLHTRLDRSVNPIADPSVSRQQNGPALAAASSLAVDEAGVTLLQSLLANLVVGTTLKLARGSSALVAVAPDASLSAAWDQAARAQAGGVTRFDLDVGVLAFAGPIRVGLAGRNLRQPDFNPGDPGGSGRLERQVRLGVALTPGFVVNRTAASQPSLTIAFDADLTRSELSAPRVERHVAAGVERWFASRRVGLRGGVRANTVGDRRPLATAGASVALRPGMLIEAQFARGRVDAGQQWSVGGRVTF